MLAVALAWSATAQGQGQEPAQVLPPFSALEARGARIGHIRVVARDIFDTADPKEDKLLFHWANSLHIETRPGVIERALLFKTGDPVSVRVIDETERLLRSVRYLYDVHIRPVAVNDGVVDIEVETHDTWSLDLGVSAGRSGGSSSSGLQLREYNLLGTGVSLSLGRSGRRRSQQHRVRVLQRAHVRNLDGIEHQPRHQQRRPAQRGDRHAPFLRAGHPLGRRDEGLVGRSHRQRLQRRQHREPVPASRTASRSLRRLVARAHRRLGQSLFAGRESSGRSVRNRARSRYPVPAATRPEAGDAIPALRTCRRSFREGTQPQPDRTTGVLCARAQSQCAGRPRDEAAGLQRQRLGLHRLRQPRLPASARAHTDGGGEDRRPVQRRAGAAPAPGGPGAVLPAAEPALAVLRSGIGRPADPAQPGGIPAAGR